MSRVHQEFDLKSRILRNALVTVVGAGMGYSLDLLAYYVLGMPFNPFFAAINTALFAVVGMIDIKNKLKETTTKNA